MSQAAWQFSRITPPCSLLQRIPRRRLTTVSVGWVSPLHVLCATYTCSWCVPTLCRIPRSHTLADLALQVAEAILDKTLPKRERGDGPPRSAPGETPLPTKFYHPSRGGGEAPLIV